MKLRLAKPLVLASGSPRRKEILEGAGFDFEVVVRPTEEHFDSSLSRDQVAEYLAVQKVRAFQDKTSSIVLAADTTVLVNNQILNKPKSKEEAEAMLEQLSGNMHYVYTGVAIMVDGEVTSFHDSTSVYFNTVSKKEIDFYLDRWQPYDKAGAYGVQEFMGMVGIEKLEGSFYNVMGLPIHKVYQELKKYIIWA